MLEAQARALPGLKDHDNKNAASAWQTKAAILGIALLSALALVAWAKTEGGSLSDAIDVDRAPAEISQSTDQPVFDNRGKWGGYAR